MPSEMNWKAKGINLALYLSVCQSFYLSFFLWVCLSIYLFVFFGLFVYLCLMCQRVPLFSMTYSLISMLIIILYHARPKLHHVRRPQFSRQSFPNLSRFMGSTGSSAFRVPLSFIFFYSSTRRLQEEDVIEAFVASFCQREQRRRSVSPLERQRWRQEERCRTTNKDD